MHISFPYGWTSRTCFVYINFVRITYLEWQVEECMGLKTAEEADLWTQIVSTLLPVSPVSFVYYTFLYCRL